MNIPAFMFFIVMNIPNTEKPTFTLMAAYPTAAECLAVLNRAPKDVKDKFTCMEINTSPEATLQRNKI